MLYTSFSILIVIAAFICIHQLSLSEITFCNRNNGIGFTYFIAIDWHRNKLPKSHAKYYLISLFF